jgi:hypothetical protein
MLTTDAKRRGIPACPARGSSRHSRQNNSAVSVGASFRQPRGKPPEPALRPRDCRSVPQRRWASDRRHGFGLLPLSLLRGNQWSEPGRISCFRRELNRRFAIPSDGGAPDRFLRSPGFPLRRRRRSPEWQSLRRAIVHGATEHDDLLQETDRKRLDSASSRAQSMWFFRWLSACLSRFRPDAPRGDLARQRYSE